MVNNIDYEQMIGFVKDYFNSNDPIGTELSYRYLFRKRFDHCLRVMKWAHRIALAENADEEIARISALFHDIGKATDVENHGETGARICYDYLKSISYDEKRTGEIIRIIRTHTNHARENNASLEAKIVSDADILDETGAIMILWDAMATAGEEAPSYDKAFERIKLAYERLRVNTPERLYTQTAREILFKHLSFIDTFLKNLGYELGFSNTLQ